MKKVCAVIVTYNKLDMLKRNIEKIREQSFKVNTVIVVNNNSTDGTKEYLNSQKDIMAIHLSENVGGAGGFEAGIGHFYSDTTDEYCWIMDDDTFPDTDSLNELMIADDKLAQNYGFLSSYVYFKDGAPCIMNKPKVSADWNERIDDDVIKVDYASFVSIIVRRDMIKKVGLPIGEFFIWGDDVEYTQRLSHELPSYFVPKSRVLHFMASNTRVDIIEDSYKRVPRYFYSFRNRFFKAKKQGAKSVIFELTRNLYLSFKILFKSDDHKFLRIKQIFKGQFSGIVFSPSIKKVN